MPKYKIFGGTILHEKLPYHGIEEFPNYGAARKFARYKAATEYFKESIQYAGWMKTYRDFLNAGLSPQEAEAAYQEYIESAIYYYAEEVEEK